MIHENIQRMSENVELREFYRFESKLVLPFSEKIFFFPLDKIFHEFLFYIELNERAQSNEHNRTRILSLLQIGCINYRRVLREFLYERFRFDGNDGRMVDVSFFFFYSFR